MTQNGTDEQSWFNAAINDSLEELKSMYNKDEIIQDYRGRTATMIALSTASEETLKFLHEHEQRVQEQDGYTALMFAAQQKNLKAVQLFCQNEAKMQSYCGNTALMCAASVGFTDSIFYLQPETQMQNRLGQTAMMIAASQGHLNFIKMLINHERDMRDKFQRTATMYAAASGQYECLKFLIQNENESHMDQDGNSSLFYAINSLDQLKYISNEEQMQQYRENCLNCVNLFYRENTIKQTYNFKKQTLLMMLAKYDLVDQMMQILNQQIKQQDDNGLTALMYAAQNGAQQATEILANYEVTMQDNEGKTASMYAAEVGSIECINSIIEQEKDMVDHNGLNIMQYAIKSGDEHFCEAFIDKYISEVDNQKQNAAHFACKYGHLDILRLLVKESFKLLTQTDINGRTPLHTAAMHDQLECINYILKQKKDLQNVKDKQNYTPVEVAVHFDNYKAFSAFLEHGDANTFKNVMLQCVAKNSYKILKFVADVSRVGKFTQCNDKHEYSSKQQRLCKQLLQQQDVEGHDLLQYAVLSGVKESIKILVFVFPQSNYKGLSPLMLLAQKDVPEDIYDNQTLELLVEFFGGQQIQKETSSDKSIGMTALMIACQSNAHNERLIKALLEVEKEIDDTKGQKAKDYAVQSGRSTIMYHFTE